MSQVAIGICLRPFGKEGAIKIESFSGEYDHFSVIEKVHLRKGKKSQDLAVESWQFGSFLSLVKLKGINTPESARLFTGWELWVPSEFACPLQKGEWYVQDMRGATVYVGDEPVGTVKDIIDTGHCQYLEMNEHHHNVLIPIIDQFIGEFSPEKIVLRDSQILS